MRGWVLLCSATVALLGGACLGDGAAQTCIDGLVCPASMVCAPEGGRCVEASAAAACQGRAEGEACRRSGFEGQCRAQICEVTRCGDGIQDADEGCDDGNAVDDDGCTNACRRPICGDAVVQAGEGCDEGLANGNDRACTAGCVAANCGDGFQWAGVESCDEGPNNLDAGSCTTSCEVATCGDGHVWVGVEACDDANTENGDGCRADCRKVEVCGDGDLDVGEACDDGAEGVANAADGCDGCVATTWLAAAILGREESRAAMAIAEPAGIAVDRAGNLYVVESGRHRVRRLAAGTGVVTTVAGTGTAGFAGDGGPATSAELSSPTGVAVDGAGTLYISDSGNHRVRRVAPDTGVITTLAGTGTAGFGGDGGAATAARLNNPLGLAVDGFTNVYVVDHYNQRVRRIAAATGQITTVVGTGVYGYNGDGRPAISARLANPHGVAVDGSGHLYVADNENHRVRRVDAMTAQISTVAGTGQVGGGGDGGLASLAQLAHPYAVAVDPTGDLYVAEHYAHRVRRVAAATGIITTAAGTGVAGATGDGGPATSATLDRPWWLAVDRTGTLYVTDSSNQRIRQISLGSGTISTTAGDGTEGGSGEGSPATSVTLGFPIGAVVDRGGNLLVADSGNARVLRVDAATGQVTTVAGTGVPGFGGDGGAATDAQLANPQGLAVDADGNLFIADLDNDRVRCVAAATGLIATVAGNGQPGFGGDNGPALGARLSGPTDVAIDDQGSLYIADYNNRRVRRVSAGGEISTAVGTGQEGTAGDLGPAASAQLKGPSGLEVDANGDLYVADGNRVRRVVRSTGIITTLAGADTAGFGGDGGPAANARLYYPRDVAVRAGAIDVADFGNHRIRRISLTTGIITTVAGGSVAGASGDGGPATSARLSMPACVTTGLSGETYVCDLGNRRLRRIDGSTGIITTVAGKVDPPTMGSVQRAYLASPRALTFAGLDLLFAGGSSGTVQALRSSADVLEVVAGRYAHEAATAELARYRASSFGTVGGVAFDAAASRLYLSETTSNRVHVVALIDPGDERTWTIAPLVNAAGVAGSTSGPALQAGLRAPTGLYFDAATRVLYIADSGNHAVRSVPVALDGIAGEVSAVAGVAGTRGYFGDGALASEALLLRPEAITRCANGDLFIADTGNHRVRRVEAETGLISTVLGDGVGASSGQGRPAATFPVDSPQGLACDDAGNLFVSSRTTIRLLPAAISPGESIGIVDGTGPVQTIYGAPPRVGYPENSTACLTGLLHVDATTIYATDACQGVLVELWRQPLP